MEARRASEICTQLVAMGFLRRIGPQQVMMTDDGMRFFDYVTKDDKDKVHGQLLRYGPYSNVSRILDKEDLTLLEIASRSGLNQVATETILRLLEWTGKLQRSSDEHYYLAALQELSIDTFATYLDHAFVELTKSGLGIKREFVRIPELRDSVCRCLHLTFPQFDHLLSETVSKYPGKFELSSAPPRVAGERSEGGLRLHDRQYFYIRRLRAEVIQ